MNKSISSIVKEREETFHKDFPVFSHFSDEDFNSFTRTTILQVLESERERLEGKKKPYRKVMSIMMKKGILGEPLKKEINPMIIYNSALSDNIAYLDEQIQAIKEMK